MNRKLSLNHAQEEIKENLNKLKSKLEVTTTPFEDFLCLKLTSFCVQHPTTKVDINLYGSLKQSLAGIASSDLTWRDPEASMILSDNSDIVKNLGSRQKNIFMEPQEKMKCALSDSVVAKCKVAGRNLQVQPTDV